MKCPNCGAGELREFINRKKKRRMGSCPACRKMVTLAKIEETDNNPAPAKQEQKASGSGQQPPPPAGKRGDNKRQPAAKQRTKQRSAERRAVQSVQQTKVPGWGERIAGWLNREL